VESEARWTRVRATCQAFTVFAYHPDVQPLLASSSLRVDVGGTSAVDGLSLSSTGERVLVLGGARALFEAAAGLRGIARGELRVADQDPLEAIRAGALAGAPLDPPLPASWTVRQYVTWSGRLAGHPRRTATAMADDAIERMKLGSLSNGKLGAVALAARRGVVIAAALATGAGVLLLEDPIAALPAESARSFARIVARALADRRMVVFAPRVALDSPLALAAEEAIVIDGSRVAAQGAPAEIAAGESAFVLRIGGDARAFVSAVQARGARLLAAGDGARDPRCDSITIDLGELRTLDLLRIAASSNAVVLELRPLAWAFA
jgi:ABC-type multidrug transport system ATPase subunit